MLAPRGDYVLSRADVTPSRIVYFGESLGSGVAVGWRSSIPQRAVILRSPFTSFVDVGRVHYRVAASRHVAAGSVCRRIDRIGG